MFTVMGGRTSFGVLYPAIVADVGWSAPEVTGAFSAGLLVYGPAALGVGMLVDRLGCRWTMLGGCACLVVGMVGVAASTELSHLYLAYILVTGFGSAATGFITIIKMLSMRANTRFPAAFGIASTGMGIGALVVSPAVQSVVDLAGWRVAALTVAGLVGFGLLPMVLLFAPGRETASERRDSARSEVPGVRSFSFAVFFVSNAALGSLLLLPTHQVAHLIEAGFPPIVAATAAGACGALIAVGGVAGGWLLERWRRERVLMLTTALFGIGTFALVASTPAAAWLLVPFIVAGGAGRGVLGVALGSAQTRVFAGAKLGRMTGILDLGYGVGGFLGPWLTAVVHDSAGSFAPGLAGAIVAGGLVALSIPLGIRLSGPRP